jgi:hypothetical protein
MSTFVTLLVVVMFIAVFLVFATMLISWLKGLQKTRYPQWTFLDYLSVGYAKHLYLKYVIRKK